MLVTDRDAATGQEKVEVAHEAVIGSWNRLRTWLVEDREFLLWQQRARSLEQEWVLSGQEDGALLRGRLLYEAEGWLNVKGHDEIDPDVCEFVERSQTVRDRAAGALALARADQLLTGRVEEIQATIESLRSCRAWVDEHLFGLLDRVPERDRWRIRLALLEVDAGQAHDLVNELDRIEPVELLAVRDALARDPSPVLVDLWATASGDRNPQRRFRAACVLAGLDPESPRWPQIIHDVADILVRENVLFMSVWVAALQQLAMPLLDPLEATLEDDTEREAVRQAAATVLLRFGREVPQVIATVLRSGPLLSYSEACGLVTGGPDEIRDQVREHLIRAVAARPQLDFDETQRVRHGRARAAAACALLHLGEVDPVVAMFRDREDMEAATQFVHQAHTRGIVAAQILELVDRAGTEEEVFTALLALSTYPPTSLPTERATAVLDRVAADYANHASAAVHAACRYLPRVWGRHDVVDKVDQTVVPPEPPGGRGWFTVKVEDRCFTFVIFEPGCFTMGTPSGEQGRGQLEDEHQVQITRRFALCTREITKEEFERFLTSEHITGWPDITEWSTHSAAPIVAPTWYESVRYCNWLSARAGLPASRWCYEGTDRLESTGDCPYHFDRTGFRLPTEAEWEYACRAGTITTYSFGSDATLLDRYGWSQSNSEIKTHEPGLLMPSIGGLYDIHFNCWEWCQDWYDAYPDGSVTDPVGPPTGARRALRGGCWNLGPRWGRSGCRNAHLATNRNYYIGLRLALTVPSGVEGVTQ